MGRASPIQNSFNAGEFSPRAAGRVDIAKYGAACSLLEGFVPLIQGPAQRRGGFRFVAEVKNSGDRTWLVKFEFNTTQAYQLEFGDHYIRFYANHGQVISGGVPYEIASPYSAADLTGPDGNLTLRFIESADVIYITHGSYAPRKLSRLGPTNWTIASVQTSGGPFKTLNLAATTVYASAATGAVTLTASAAIFAAQNVGSLFYLEQKSALSVHSWEAAAAITTGDLRRSDGKNYVALTTGTTGGDKPTHSTGAIFDGDTGVQWQYTDPGFGCVLITGFTDTTHVTGTVVSPFPGNPTSQLPDNAVGSGNATTRWAFAAWSDIEGWPTQVAFFRGRLAFGRGQTVWLSVSGDYETFTATDQSSVITADMAITEQLQSAKVNDIQWMEANSSSIDVLLCGTAGSEFVVKSMTENSAYGTDNHTAVEISTLGSRSMAPVQAGNVVLFVQRAGSKLRDIDYDFYSNKFQSVDQSILAEHIPKIGVQQIVYQQEPYSLIWGVRSDGLLICMTYSREQYPDAPHGGWHRHPLGGDGIVESLSVIPAPDTSRDELWVITRRTINGVTKRYVEYAEWERRPNDDPQDQFYVDAGLTLDNSQLLSNLTVPPEALLAHATNVHFVTDGLFFVSDPGRQIHVRYSVAGDEGVLTFRTGKATITSYIDSKNVLATIDAVFPAAEVIPAGGWRLTVTSITGLDHLEGMTVDILADGASHPQRVVSGGAITLQQPASKVQVGLGFPAKLKTMRLNAGAQDGTSQGKNSRINQAALRLLETTSLRYGTSFDDMFDVDFRNALMDMDNPPDVFGNGEPEDTLVDWPGEYNTTPWLCFDVVQPMAATIVAIMPQVSVSDRA